MPAPVRNKLLKSLSKAGRQEIEWGWNYHARPNQRIPPGDWTYWMVLAGRGFGKTRVGAETVRKWVGQGCDLIHLVGPTAGDTRDVMVQGESGLLRCFPPHQKPHYEPSKRLVTFHNGAIARLFSADEPERLRGPQCKSFWADEVCSWRFGQEAWDNLQFGFRLGNDPRGVITTTPKPLKLLKEILADPATVITRGSTYDNRANLAPKFFKSIVRKYEGTRLGRQELLAEILDDVPGALWTRDTLERNRIALKDMRWEMLTRIVVGVDPAVSTTDESDETGIIVAAIARSGHVIILDDWTLRDTPLAWATAVHNAYIHWRADRVVAEVNNGGNLVESNLRVVASNISYRAVRASDNKYTRAQPVAALYEQGRIHHMGCFPLLEDQLCEYVPRVSKKSPDRMDALVWAVTELLGLDNEEVSVDVNVPLARISAI